jgi:hypothetical protein
MIRELVREPNSDEHKDTGRDQACFSPVPQGKEQEHRDRGDRSRLPLDSCPATAQTRSKRQKRCMQGRRSRYRVCPNCLLPTCDEPCRLPQRPRFGRQQIRILQISFSLFCLLFSSIKVAVGSSRCHRAITIYKRWRSGRIPPLSPACQIRNPHYRPMRRSP